MLTSIFGQTGPGGVGNASTNLLWLKADAGTSTSINGSPVATWLDQSGNAMNATQVTPSRQPKYVANAVNGRPSVLLNNAVDAVYDYFLLPSGFSNFTNGLTAFVITKPNSTISWSNFFNLGGGTVHLYDDAVSFSRNSNTIDIWYQVVANGLDSYMSRASLTDGAYQILNIRQDAGVSPGTSTGRIYKNNVQSAPNGIVNVPRNFLRTDNYVGHDSWGHGDFNGEIAEIIIYNYAVNSAQRNITANYLSSKYGISIGATDRYTYDASNGYDVAGIGRVNLSNLHSSATSAGILNISAPSGMGDTEYLLFGHNNGSASSWVSTEVPTDALNLNYLRIEREWKVNKTGDVGTVTVTGSFSNLPALPAGYFIGALLVDNDGDFSAGAKAYSLADFGSNNYGVTNVTLNEGDYLTFAIYNISNEDPCTALTVNVGASCTFQRFSNEGALNSVVGDPGNCDGTGVSGYSGGDVWFKVVVPASGSLIVNTNTESAAPSNLEWAYRIGIAAYSGTCGALTKINCQISPLSKVPPDAVTLSITGRTPGETLYLRMWEWGNTDNGKFYLCVYDQCFLPPVITGSIPVTTVEGCDGSFATPAVTTVLALEALGLNISDGCTPDASLVVTHLDTYASNCPIIVTRTYSVTDANLSSSSYVQTIYVDDNTAPVVTGTLSPLNIEGCDVGSAPAAVTTVSALESMTGGVTITDVCTIDALITVTHSDIPSGTCPIIITRTYTVFDACGNSATLLQTINVDDNTAPVVTGSLAPATAEGCSAADAPAAATTVLALESMTGGVTVNDVCTADAGLTVTHSDVSAGSCPIVVTRTYTVSDLCGNFANIVQTINIDDNTAPVITGTLTATTAEGCSALDAPAAATTVLALETMAGGISITDACTSDALLVVTHSDVSAGTCPVVITRTYTITDGCGNFSTIVHTIRVDDNTPPVVSGSLSVVTVEGCSTTDAPAAVTTVAALELLAGSINITDGCTADGSLTVTHSDASSGSCPIVITRTYKVTDGCGNYVSIAQTINVDDNTSPVVSGTLTATTVEGCGIGAAPAAVTTVAALEALDGGITITDACSSDALITVTHSDATGGSCPIVITRTYTITDGCGNASTIIHTINVDDNTAPVVTGTLTSTTVEGCGISAAPAAVTTVAALETMAGGVTITDACTADGSLAVTHSDVVVGACPIVITRTYTITDGCGNASTVIHTINVDDNTAPVVTGALTSTTVEGCSAADAPVAATTVAALETMSGGVTITDACTADGLLTVTHSDTPVGSCPLVITRIYTITDGCGNASTVTHTINVDDNTAPVVSGTLDPITVEGCNLGMAPVGVTTVMALEAMTGGVTITDACTADASLTVTHSDATSGTCPIVITRTYTVSDLCGNSATLLQTINVDDNTAPVVTGSLAPATAEGCSAADAPAAATTVLALESMTGGVTVNDVCTADAGLTVTHSDVSAGSCPIVVTRTYTVSDLCGNFANIVQTINIDDNTAPVITGTLTATTAEGCSALDAPAAATTVLALETMAGGISIN